MVNFKTWRQSLGFKIASRCLLSLAIVFGFILHVPKVLAFPYHAEIQGLGIYSETPIAPEIKTIVTRSQALISQSKIYMPDGYGKTIYLTNGGWRWRILSFPRSSGAFGLSRPVKETIVMNRSDIAVDKVFSPISNGRTRSLSDTIAHEQTHGLIRNRYGVKSLFAPTWKIEGYSDYVAQASSLTDAWAAELEKTDPEHPALVYFQGRKRVAAILAANGGDVDALFKD